LTELAVRRGKFISTTPESRKEHEGLQGDISEVSGRNEKTKQRPKQREHGVLGDIRRWKKSIVFNLMWSWRRTTARSDSSRTCMFAVWLVAFADRPRSRWDRDTLEVSRFSCMLFLRVRRLLDYAEPACHLRFIAARRVAFPWDRIGSALRSRDFSKLNHLAHRCPCLRCDDRLTAIPARLGVRMDSLSPFL